MTCIFYLTLRFCSHDFADTVSDFKMEQIGEDDKYFYVPEDYVVDGCVALEQGYYETVELKDAGETILGIYIPVNKDTLERLPSQRYTEETTIEIDGKVYEIHVDNNEYSISRADGDGNNPLTERQKRESKSNNMFHKLIESFKDQENDTIKYPDYYAGGYIAEDGSLVVLYKEGEVCDMPLLESVSYGASYSTEPRQYSFNELYHTYDQIAELCKHDLDGTDDEIKKRIQDFYIKETDNQVYVGIIGMQKDAQEWVEKNVDYPDMLVFEEAVELTH